MTTSPAPLTPLLSFDEAAAYLRIHRTGLSKLVSRGEVAFIPTGENPAAKSASKCFLQSDLDSFIAKRRRRAVAAAKVRKKPRAISGNPW